MGVADRLEVVVEHLAWCRSILQEPWFPRDAVDPIEELADRLSTRIAHRDLRIGVFGEFSSGKSTLLNGLIGSPLLPSSALVTTAVETVLRPAAALGLTVTLTASGERMRLGTDEFAALMHAVGQSEAAVDPAMALRVLMRTPGAVQQLAKFEIDVPHSMFGSEVVIIDTPGFNATDAGHHEVARSVAERVDLAVVLIPATAPCSLALLEFVRTTLADLSERCVFVLTKGRLIPQRERAGLVAWVRDRLASSGFAAAEVLRADAADVALMAVGGPLPAEADDVDLDEAVAELESLAGSLARSASERRDVLIAASVETLLTRMLIALTESSEARRVELEHARERLDAVPIVDLDEFLDEWRRQLMGEMRASVARDLKERARNAPSKALSDMRTDAISKVTASGDLSVAARQVSGKTAELLRSWVRAEIRGAAECASALVEDRASQLAGDFDRSYGELAALAGHDATPPPFDSSAPKVSVPDVQLKKALDPLEKAAVELDSQLNRKFFGGAAAGALAGSAIAPGVGTVIGGIVGAFMGAGRDKQLKDLSARLTAAHTSALEAARTSVTGATERVVQSAGKATDVIVSRYLELLGPQIATLVTDERQQRSELTHDLERIRSVTDEAQRRRRTTDTTSSEART